MGWIQPTGMPIGPLSDRSAQSDKAPLAAAALLRSAARGRGSEPVDEEVQAEPHHVDEVPVPGRAFEAEVALAA